MGRGDGPAGESEDYKTNPKSENRIRDKDAARETPAVNVDLTFPPLSSPSPPNASQHVTDLSGKETIVRVTGESRRCVTF
jgi:hypothetical protein